VENRFRKNSQYYKFCFYGFFKNLRFFDAFLILFFLEKGLDFLEIGLLYSLREIAIIILEIPSGVIADALGRRKTLITSFFVYILSFVLFYFSQSYILLLTAMLLFAFADAFRTGVHKAMIFQYLKINHWENQKVNYYGHTRSWSQMGSAVSALAAGFIVFYAGNYSSIFLASAIPYLLGMGLIYSYPKYLEGETGFFSMAAISQKFKQVILAFGNTLKSMAYIRSLTNLSLYTGFYRAVKDYIQPLLKTFALSMPVFAWLSDDKKTAVIVGVIYFIIYLFTAFASRRSGKFNSLFRHPNTAMNRTILFGFAIGIITGLTFIVHFYIFAIIGFLAIILLENLRKPIGIAEIANLTKDEAMATSLSVESQAKSLFAALIAILLGWLADLINPGTAIVIVSAFLLLVFPVYRLKK
jgi:MFS family permease